VQGNEFDSAVVAKVLQFDPADVEERLDELDRVHGVVRRKQELELPNGSLTLRYQFVHVLYQNTLDAALQPSRRAAWSAAVARALLHFHRDQSSSLASELALLFEAGREPVLAIDHFVQAAHNAIRVYAFQEAAALARRGLELLAKLPDTPAPCAPRIDLAPAVGCINGRHTRLCRSRGRTDLPPSASDQPSIREYVNSISGTLWSLERVSVALRTAAVP
jgi:hypothetical protein